MKASFVLVMILTSSQAFAADVFRKIVAELDPVAPASASYEENENGIVTSKWGGNVDFNVGGVISTGPEFWTGTFTIKGEDGVEARREDFQDGERHKIDATRLRWNFTKWGYPNSMRHWYLKLGYSYTRVNSRANRYTEESEEGDAITPGTILLGQSPDDETDLVTDLRHGVVAGFGNRWMFWNQHLTVTLGASVTANFKRTVSIDSKDPNARADFDEIIETLPDTRISTRPTPEANLSFGYAW